MTVKGWYDTPSLFILQGTLLLSAYGVFVLLGKETECYAVDGNVAKKQSVPLRKCWDEKQ